MKPAARRQRTLQVSDGSGNLSDVRKEALVVVFGRLLKYHTEEKSLVDLGFHHADLPRLACVCRSLNAAVSQDALWRRMAAAMDTWYALPDSTAWRHDSSAQEAELVDVSREEREAEVDSLDAAPFAEPVGSRWRASEVIAREQWRTYR